MPPRRPELLAPAGSPDKLKTALHFGADAVYLGLDRFSMRATAGNFDLDELEWALGYAHERGRRVYVCVNVQPFDADLDGIERTLAALGALRPDAVIVADPGVVDLARRVAPGLSLHLSTQASVTNAAAARFWFAQGIERICVARELTIEQLGALAARAGGEVEAFVHGAVCVAYSGRCLLSLYAADRDPRKGNCAQACRFRYADVTPRDGDWCPDRELRDLRRPDGDGLSVEEDARGTHFFDARDLCALPVLDRLLDAGICALKIEGRTRSAHYVGVVVDVYRDAIDRLAAGDAEGFAARLPGWLDELQRPTNRGFSTHFYGGGDPGPDAYNHSGSRLQHENSYVGGVLRRGEDYIEVALKNPLRRGDRVEVRDRGMAREEVTVEVILDEHGGAIELGRAPSVVRIPGRFRAGAGALVRARGAMRAPDCAT